MSKKQSVFLKVLRKSKKDNQKILPSDLPDQSFENGCVVIDDSVTDEQLEKIRLKE